MSIFFSVFLPMFAGGLTLGLAIGYVWGRR